MDRAELRERLRGAGIPDGMYELTGIHHGTRPDLSFLFLEQQNDEWVVGVEERAQREVIRRFATEDEACRFLHDRLIRQVTAPPPVSQRPQEEERGRRITEETVLRIKEMMRKNAGNGEDKRSN